MIQIVNPLALVNGYILNNVAHFTQATNPTVRIDSSPLVVGDKLYRTDLSVDAFWNGTFWLSTDIHKITLFNTHAAINFGALAGGWDMPSTDTIFIVNMANSFVSTLTTGNIITDVISLVGDTLNVIFTRTLTHTGVAANSGYSQALPVNASVNTSGVRASTHTISQSGASGAFWHSAYLTYRLVMP